MSCVSFPEIYNHSSAKNLPDSEIAKIETSGTRPEANSKLAELIFSKPLVMVTYIDGERTERPKSGLYRVMPGKRLLTAQFAYGSASSGHIPMVADLKAGRTYTLTDATQSEEKRGALGHESFKWEYMPKLLDNRSGAQVSRVVGQ